MTSEHYAIVGEFVIDFFAVLGLAIIIYLILEGLGKS